MTVHHGHPRRADARGSRRRAESGSSQLRSPTQVCRGSPRGAAALAASASRTRRCGRRRRPSDPGDAEGEGRAEPAAFPSGLCSDPGSGATTSSGWRPRPVAGAGGVARPSGRGALAAVSCRATSTVDETLRTVRGRIRIGDQICSSTWLMMPLEVVYDEFTVDIAENRILRTALRRMLAVPRVSAQAGQARAPGWPLGRGGVARPASPLPAWQRTRLNARYQPRCGSPSRARNISRQRLDPVAFRSPHSSVPMWQVFEDFVGTALTESLRRYPGTTRRSQYRTIWMSRSPGGARGSVPMALDLVHLVHRRPR